MKLLNVLGCAAMTAILSVSANAACGGGGYAPPKNNSVSQQQPVQQNNAYNNGDRRDMNQPNSNYNGDRRVATSGGSAYFDVSGFHSVSGQLHLTGEQATAVINTIQDIRGKLSTGTPNFDPKQEFEKRLATILNPEQFRMYQNTTKRS